MGVLINLEVPKKLETLVSQANQVATEVLRPISRKYDRAEHTYPKELDMLAALIDGMNEGGAAQRHRRHGRSPGQERRRRRGQPQRHQPVDRARADRDVRGATSACC